MDRYKEDIDMVLKRSSFRSFGQPRSVEGGSIGAVAGRRLTINDALAYIKAVRARFQNEKHRHDEFLKVLKDVNAKRIDIIGAVERANELFKEHHDLLLGFRIFLPKSHDRPMKLEEALSFLKKIKLRFQGDDRVYNSFLDILITYRRNYNRRNNKKTVDEVYQEVAELLRDHKDLLDEFTHFSRQCSAAMLGMYSQEYEFCKQVKERLPNLRDYQEFLKCLTMFSNDFLTREDLETMVGVILGKYPDLMVGFDQFLARSKIVGVAPVQPASFGEDSISRTGTPPYQQQGHCMLTRRTSSSLLKSTVMIDKYRTKTRSTD